MSALSSSLRPHPAQTSPTSSASSQNTTPTSPYFTQTNNNHNQRHAHPYARDRDRDVRHQSSANSLSTITTNTSISISNSSHARPPTPPLLHPPPGQPFSAYLRSWGTQDLAAFLNLYRCGQYTALFQRNDIDGKVLLDLDMAALKEIGVGKVGERVKLLAGIKDLRRRAAAGSSGGGASGRPSSRIELRLNGAATPPLDHGHGHGSPVHPPSIAESARSQPSRFAQPSAASSSARRLNSSRPPPLDLQHYSSSRVLPQAYQNATPSSSSLGRSNSTTPRPIQQPVQNHQSQHQASISRPSLPTQTNSNTTVTPASNSVPAPNRPGNLNLRAPPPRDVGRRSPSPINADVTGYVDRPLPPPPAPGNSQSSAAEYANSITQQHQQRHGEGGRSTPTWAQSDHQYGLPKGPAPGTTNKVAAIKSESSAASHRKSPSISNTIASASTSTTPKQSSPIKAKFSAMMGGRSTPQPQVVHPFAANRSREDLVPERHGSDNSMKRSITPTPGYVVGSGAMSGKTINPTSADRERTRRTTGNESLASSSTSASAGALSLDDLRRQLVKFVNAEDGTMRTVNVMHVTSGVEVLERALKKFGKWGAATSRVSTDTESDEDGDRLEVDGWGVYAESDADNAKPLSEASLLGICLSHRDGSVMREKGLTLRRTRKLQNRKNMEDFLGETPPPPMSPTSPMYSGPRFGVVAQTPERDGKNGGSGSGMLTPPPRDRPGAAGANSIAASKKMNRASTVSVMSGLGVPMPDVPPSPSTARSPSSASFLGGKKKSMYNFFGHRPPSELISNHLAEYFPSAKKRDVEKARHSMLRMSSGPGIRGSIAAAPSASDLNGRMSLDIPNPPSSTSTANKRSSMVFSSSAGIGHGLGLGQVEKLTASPPRRNRAAGNRTTIIASPPPASTIPEESEGPEIDGANAAGGVPRVSVSNDDGRVVRPTIDGESESDSVESVKSQPPLLPPFEPFNDLADSLQAYSPSSKSQAQMGSSTSVPVPTRPRSIALNRRDSAGSTRSRISMLSQLRRNRDRSDTASLLTVDEITAEVENRRASTITFEDGESDEEEEIILPAPPQVVTGDVPIDENEESEREDSEDESTDESSSEESDDDDDEDDEDEDEEDEDDEEDKEHGKAFTSTGSKRMFKWIKGALIGAGSFGSVFLGMDAQSGLLMAVKQVELPTGSARNEERKRAMVDALEREIELLKELQHENIVQYLDSSSDGAHLNIFLEYVPGGSVAALLNNYGAFEEALVRNFVRQILTGLNYLHEREIIHRDIKGANILVDNKGGIKISDFGISKKVENNLMTGMRTNRPSLQGSVFWMAPEIVKQTSYTSKADIWSVGCLVVEMLTGTHPWADLTQMQAIFRIGSTAPRPATPSDISPEAADLLNKSFEIDHLARPTAKELLEHPFIAVRRLSVAAGQGTISNSEAQRQMGMAMAAAGQGMGMMMKA